MAEEKDMQDLHRDIEVIIGLDLEEDLKDVLINLHLNFGDYIVEGKDPFRISREELERKREALKLGIKSGSWYAKFLKRVELPLYEDLQYRQEIFELYKNGVLPKLGK